MAQTDSAISSILFSGIEAETRSFFASSGGKIAYPIGLDTTVFVQASAGTSLSDLRRARDAKLDIGGVAAEARLLLGAEKSFGPLFVSAGFGPSLNQFTTKSGLPRLRSGIALQTDLWFRPTPQTVWNLTSVADSGVRSLWARLRYGYRPGGWPVTLGPEISATTSLTTQKIRIGLHASEWSLGRVHLAIAGGWLWNKRRPGQYLSASAYVKY